MKWDKLDIIYFLLKTNWNLLLVLFEDEENVDEKFLEDDDDVNDIGLAEYWFLCMTWLVPVTNWQVFGFVLSGFVKLVLFPFGMVLRSDSSIFVQFRFFDLFCLNVLRISFTESSRTDTISSFKL